MTVGSWIASHQSKPKSPHDTMKIYINTLQLLTLGSPVEERVKGFKPTLYRALLAQYLG